MASKHFGFPMKTLGVKQCELNFRWSPNGISSPNATSIIGRGVASIVRNSTGKFTITLDDKYNHLLKFANTRAYDGAPGAASESQVTVIGDVANGNTSASTYVTFIYTITSTSTDVSAATSNVFLTSMTFEDSTVDD